MHGGKTEQLKRNKQFRSGIRLKAVVTDVSDDANDFQRAGHRDPQFLADRIDLAEVLSRHCFIDETEGVARRFVELVQKPAAIKWNPHRLKISGQHDASLNARTFVWWDLHTRHRERQAEIRADRAHR